MIFVRAPNPVWLFVDSVGQVLNDQYYISFLTNVFPYLPQNVFMDVNGTTPWPNPLEFFPNGTLPNNLYFDPNLVYRLEIRQGPTQSDPLIYEINNFQPGQGTITPNELDIVTADNQITNPQFAEVFFTNGYTITTAGTYNIAPGWNLIIQGAGGTTTLNQLVLSGTDSVGSPIIIGNPPFALQIANVSWSSVVLEQRFNNNGALWQNGAVSGVILARADSASQIITMNYVESDGGRVKQIFTHLFTIANFQFFGGAVNVDNIPVASNSDLSTVAYTNIDLILPPTGTVEITNIQVTGQTVPLPSSFNPATDLPAYDQETVERNIDHQFHVYQDSLLNQSKDNLLTGWTFSQNPYQFWSNVFIPVPTNQYTLDQTIIIQQAYVASAIGNNVKVGQGSPMENYSMAVSSLTNTSQFAIIQYIDTATIQPYWGQILSAMVRAYFVTQSGTPMGIKARLIYRTTLPPTISQTEPISSWTVGSDPVFSAGWTAITPKNDPSYAINGTPTGFSFNGFQLPECTTNTMILGIVIYSTENMNPTVQPEGFVFDRVSLTNNDFAIDASPETYDETLRKCQFYYEKSYPPTYGPGTVNGTASILGLQSAPAFVYVLSNDYLFARSFTILYKQTKRAIPTIILYSPNDGLAGFVYAGIWQNNTNPPATSSTNPRNYAASNFSYLPSISVDEAFFLALSNAGNSSPNNAILSVASGNTLPGDEGIILYQYTADSRLGM